MKISRNNKRFGAKAFTLVGASGRRVDYSTIDLYSPAIPQARPGFCENDQVSRPHARYGTGSRGLCRRSRGQVPADGNRCRRELR